MLSSTKQESVSHRLMAATVEDVMVLASEGVGVSVMVEPRTEEAEQPPPGMEPLLAVVVSATLSKSTFHNVFLVEEFNIGLYLIFGYI